MGRLPSLSDARAVSTECVAAGGERAPVQSDVFVEQACDEARVFHHEGTTAATSEELLAFGTEHARQLSSAPGVGSFSVDTAGCTTADGGTAHLHVRMTPCVRPAGAMLELLETLLNGASIQQREFFVELDYAELPHPRCDQDDSSCGSIPYYSESGPSETSLADRHPVHRRTPEMGTFSGGPCAHDGECVRAGCGNHCVSWTVPSFSAVCPAYGALEPVFCGCVAGACTWFTD